MASILRKLCRAAAFFLLSWITSRLQRAAAAFPASQHSSFSNLGLLKEVYLSTAEEEFKANDTALDNAIAWHAGRLHRSGRSGPHIACAEYAQGHEAFEHLQELLGNKSYVRRLSHNIDYGTCFIATAPFAQAADLTDNLAAYGFRTFFPIPAMLKVLPGLIDYNSTEFPTMNGTGRVKATFGTIASLENVRGLSVTLSPGFLPQQDDLADEYFKGLHVGLMSDSLDLYATNFWADPGTLGVRPSHGEGAVRAREWTLAADCIHGLSRGEAGPTPGNVCSWNDISMIHGRRDMFIITGVDHLLPRGRGAGGREGAESDELQIACFMSLISYLASVPEVLRIAPLHKATIKNAVASAITESGSIDRKPITDAGLSGDGEVIQIVDTGVDETSCYFVDEDGGTVEHGYFFDEFFLTSSAYTYSLDQPEIPYDLSRRKIVQYIQMVRSDSTSQEMSFSTTGGGVYPWSTADGYEIDLEDGHGTHTAGSAAGATLTTPAETVTCNGTDELGCLGDCLNETVVTTLLNDDDILPDFDVLCPQFDCDSLGDDHYVCLDEDVATTLTDNGGVAPGAKLTIFDVSNDGLTVLAAVVGNALWEVTEGTGCMLHSNSWAGDTLCMVDSICIEYDEYMYENPEHLLLFAAGNSGDMLYDSTRDVCTIESPAIAKNVLAVGASSSGSTRLTYTAADGTRFVDSIDDLADIDTVAFFSSYGLTSDDRIKPDVVAPGDQILSASSDATDSLSCQLVQSSGTSMSTPIVAGAAALIRQYFNDENYYMADLSARGLCGESSVFACAVFTPFAATLKAMLVNGANLMGGSAEPDGFRGFGRVQLDGVLPMDGANDTALFVADAADTSMEENTVHTYNFTLSSGTDVDLRATLAWIDPAASDSSTYQLVHDLDLKVVSPGGTEYQMWSTGADTRNVIERVIVEAADIDADNSGFWLVQVSSAELTSADQPYSLVVTGPIIASVVIEEQSISSSAAHTIFSGSGSLTCLLVMIVMLTTTLINM